jgi:hypothetical protein
MSDCQGETRKTTPVKAIANANGHAKKETSESPAKKTYVRLIYVLYGYTVVIVVGNDEVQSEFWSTMKRRRKTKKKTMRWRTCRWS